MRRFSSVLLLGMLFVLVPLVSAQTTSNTLRFGPGAFTPCAAVPIPPCAGDPSPISGMHFNIYENAEFTSISPLLLIIGIPGTPAVNPTIGSIVFYDEHGPVPASPTSSLTLSSSSFTGATFTTTMVATENAYDKLGLGPASASNSFTNWSSFTNAVTGSTPTFYTLLVYEIFFGFDRDDLLDIFMSTGIPLGSVLLGFACATGSPSVGDGDTTNDCLAAKGPANSDFTNWTFAGGTTVVPEPATITLLGFALLAVGWHWRKKAANGEAGL